MKSEFKDKIEERQYDSENRFNTEISLLKRELQEKDKRLEVINFEHYEELKIQIEMKDKEIAMNQE